MLLHLEKQIISKKLSCFWKICGDNSKFVTKESFSLFTSLKSGTIQHQFSKWFFLKRGGKSFTLLNSLTFAEVHRPHTTIQQALHIILVFCFKKHTRYNSKWVISSFGLEFLSLFFLGNLWVLFSEDLEGLARSIYYSAHFGSITIFRCCYYTRPE